LNGDEIPDFLSVDGGNQVSVRLGRGDGTFGAQATYTTGTVPISVSTADLNGDGIKDLLSADYISGQISVRLGKGDGTFGAQSTYATGLNPYSVSTADLNGDGITDLLSADNSSSQVSLRLGNADATGRRNNLVTALDLTSIQGAREALTKTSKLLNNISQELGNIGAVQSRLQISASNLAVRVENYAAARSRITDVDVAQESADLVRGQILQQAGAAILSQANQQPSLALTLLRQ
jgi:flagellin-like hook-associated protein FlgL